MIEVIRTVIVAVPDKVQNQLAISIEFMLNYLPKVEKVNYD